MQIFYLSLEMLTVPASKYSGLSLISLRKEYVLEKIASVAVIFLLRVCLCACVCVCACACDIVVLEQVLLDDVLTLKLMFILKAVIVH